MGQGTALGVSTNKDFDTPGALDRDAQSPLLTSNPDGTLSKPYVDYYSSAELQSVDLADRLNRRYKSLGLRQMMDGLSVLKNTDGLQTKIDSYSSVLGVGASVGTGYQTDAATAVDLSTVPVNSVIIPVAGYAGSVPSPGSGLGFGDSRDGGARKHQGVDFMAKVGTPCISPTSGTIISTCLEDKGLGGLYVMIKSSISPYSFYGCHLSSVSVAPGTAIKAGDIFGYVGFTGNARAGGEGNAHLHFGLKSGTVYIDPRTFFAKAVRV